MRLLRELRAGSQRLRRCRSSEVSSEVQELEGARRPANGEPKSNLGQHGSHPSLKKR
jgi:hypothetical protein